MPRSLPLVARQISWRPSGGDEGEHLPPRVEDQARTCGAEAGGPALPLRVSSRIGVAIAGRARGVGHHLSPARSAVAREAGAPGSSAVRRLPGGGDAAGERRVATALARTTVTVSCRAFASGREGRCRVGCHEAGVRATFAARPAGFCRLRGLEAAWRGRHSPDRRVIVSYVSRVTEGSPSALGGIALEGHVRRSAGGLPPTEGGWVPLGGAEGSPSAGGIALSTCRIARSSYRTLVV